MPVSSPKEVDEMVDFRRVVALRRWREKEAPIVLAAWRAGGQGLGTFARVPGFEDQRLRWWRDRLGGQPALLPVRVVKELEMEAAELALILEGIDLRGARRLCARASMDWLP